MLRQIPAFLDTFLVKWEMKLFSSVDGYFTILRGACQLANQIEPLCIGTRLDKCCAKALIDDHFLCF